MKFQKQYIFIFLIFFISIVICSIFWTSIRLDINRYDIVGQYSLNNYNPSNDIIRYVLFISIPFLAFLVSKLFFFKINIQDFLKSFKIDDQKFHVEKKIYYLFFILLGYIIFEFFSLNFPLHKIDIYHEGQRLSSAYKSLIDNSLWSGSYVTVGIIYETIATKFIWQLFNTETIGLMRFLDIIFIFFTKILLVQFLFEVTKYTKLDLKFKLFFFFIVSLLSLNLINYNLYSTDHIHFREIPILITLIVVIKSFNKSSVISNLVLGFLSLFVFLWSIDRGIVFSLFLILFCTFLIFNKRYKDIIYLFISISIFWLIFYLFQVDEFNAFLSNTFSVVTELSYVHGIIHPAPFSDEENSSRATKNLIAILLSIVFSINFLLSKDTSDTKKFKFILLFLSTICFLSYIYALGRTDGPHLKQAFGFPSIFLIIIITYFLLKNISNWKISIFNNSKILNQIPLIIVILIILFKSDYVNMLSYKERFLTYINLGDEKFLTEEDKYFINDANNHFKNENCLQLFTNDAALLYLLRKPSCSKFYFFWSIGSKKNQKKLINNSTNIKYIITNGTTDNWSLPLDIKYPILYNFINNNFIAKTKIGNRTILYRKN